MLVAPRALPTSRMSVDASLAPRGGPPAHVTVTAAGFAELPGAVTDAAALAGAGGGAVHGACAKTVVLASVKLVNATRTTRCRTPGANTKSCMAVLQRVCAVCYG